MLYGCQYADVTNTMAAGKYQTVYGHDCCLGKVSSFFAAPFFLNFLLRK